jgi:hypothetical protein
MLLKLGSLKSGLKRMPSLFVFSLGGARGSIGVLFICELVVPSALLSVQHLANHADADRCAVLKC